MRKIKDLLLAGIFAVLALGVTSSPALAKENLTIVPNQKVCMVTNMVFPNEQIPVSHSGKTYYGCCQGCKKTLSQDASARTAIDPVTKKSVDKATAVIAARDDGSVIYFESQTSFQKFQKSAK